MSGYNKQSDFIREVPQRWRSQTRKSPIPKCTWQWHEPTNPTWEKEFVSSVGCIPWDKFVIKKRWQDCFHHYVDRWDDSAAEEAFRNAKNRFWAKWHNQPCDIPLPDPDMYNDEVDWNAKIDQELIKDMEREPSIANNEVKEDSSSDSDVSSPYAEWEDVEEIPNTGEANNEATPWTGWGENDENVVNRGYPVQQNSWNTSWHRNYNGRFRNGENSMTGAGPSRYRSGYKGRIHGDTHSVRARRWQNSWNSSRQWNHEGGFNAGGNSMSGAGPSRYRPGYRRRFHGDYNNAKRGRWNGRWNRRGSYVRWKNLQRGSYGGG